MGNYTTAFNSQEMSKVEINNSLFPLTQGSVNNIYTE